MAPAPSRLGASLPLPPDLAMCRRVAARAEELGYESLWVADTGAGPDAFVVAAAAGLATRRVRVGTAVVPIYTRALPVLAAGAGSCAQLMAGRSFVLGLGVSSETIVEAWGGVPYRRPRTRRARGRRALPDGRHRRRPHGARRHPPDDGAVLRDVRLQPLHRLVRLRRGGPRDRRGVAGEGPDGQRRRRDRRDDRPARDHRLGRALPGAARRVRCGRRDHTHDPSFSVRRGGDLADARAAG